MADASEKVWQTAKLLNRYYDKIGKAAAGIGRCPRFSEFRAGYGLVDTTNPADPILLDIPPEMTTIPEEFYRGLVEAQYSSGLLLCKCEIPANAVSSPKRHNLIGIFDEDSDLIAVCATLPDWVTPTEIYRAFPAISFPVEKP